MLLNSLPLKPLNYESDAPIILTVDTSYIAVGFFLCQADSDSTKIRHYVQFGSITLNDRESRFLQAKLEICGLYSALRVYKLYLIRCGNLMIEVDAQYIKGMLAKPDISPLASINRWILVILTFHITLVHVPCERHSPIGLSRRREQPDNKPKDNEPDDEEEFIDWIHQVYGFLHFINPMIPKQHQQSMQVSAFVEEVIGDEEGGKEENEDRNNPTDDIARILDTMPTAKNLISYDDFPRSVQALPANLRLSEVQNWHSTLVHLIDMADHKYSKFVKMAQRYFVKAKRLWRKDKHGRHKLVLEPNHRLAVL